ncbi:hypothetical protein QEZ54_16820 [Catellatospora sp. KI3]|uniref:hypothetical protein n=1 Tax=Catellatospora sp. KI3 TaxID=3041620 RepID=UPI002482E4AB|nr:hypothetical protein [Catellatospora sp. KI3]MDI1462638.1 hypothetical protein [Catellatospora sp. KI3]
MIGSIGGLVFILINAGQLSAPVDTVVRIVGVLGFVAVVWFAVIRPSGARGPAEAPSRRAIRIYGTSVTAMVLGIFVGANVINNVLHQPVLTLPWVVLLVGAHFLPFAGAFHAPVFARLGWTMIGLAVAGGVLALTVDDAASAWTGVLAGICLLAFSAAGSQQAPARAEPAH